MLKKSAENWQENVTRSILWENLPPERSLDSIPEIITVWNIQSSTIQGLASNFDYIAVAMEELMDISNKIKNIKKKKIPFNPPTYYLKNIKNKFISRTKKSLHEKNKLHEKDKIHGVIWESSHDHIKPTMIKYNPLKLELGDDVIDLILSFTPPDYIIEAWFGNDYDNQFIAIDFGFGSAIICGFLNNICYLRGDIHYTGLRKKNHQKLFDHDPLLLTVHDTFNYCIQWVRQIGSNG